MKLNFTNRSYLRMVSLIILATLPCCTTDFDKEMIDTKVLELTISEIHRSFEKGDLTSEQLVSAYLKRIEYYDQATMLNSIIIINPHAIQRARELDEEYKKTGTLRPLHGVPVIVKDNYHTEGLQTTAGSIALKGFIPDKDAFQVRKLKEAGAIVLAKSNMAEWAFSPMHTESSLGGTTRNPYNLQHVPAGSSGGTAAAVAANFGAVGLGSDTGNSIRGPSSHNALVGFRSTLGLTSRAGIVPLYLRNDVGGPMCRTVEDATRILQIIAGYDQEDPLTKYSEGKVPEDYLQYLRKDGLQNVRIGILRQLSEDDPHPEIKTLFDQAIIDLEVLGAEIVDPFVIPMFDSLREDQWCADFRKDINQYLETYVKRDSLKNLDDIIASGKFSGFVENRLNRFKENDGRWGNKEIPCGNPYTDPMRIAFRETIEMEMDRMNVEAIIYPSWNHPPATIEDFQEGYKGDNSQVIAPHTGQPAFSIPMGYTSGNLPAGLQFLGRMYDEPTLIKLAYAYEQGTNHRIPPERFPPLKENSPD